MRALSPSPVRTAWRTHSPLITGSIPGMAASTSDTCALGAPPNAVDAPENSLALDVTWACTSMPMTTSQSPLAPLISFDAAFCPLMVAALSRYPTPDKSAPRPSTLRATMHMADMRQRLPQPIGCRHGALDCARTPARSGARHEGNTRSACRHDDRIGSRAIRRRAASRHQGDDVGGLQ